MPAVFAIVILGFHISRFVGVGWHEISAGQEGDREQKDKIDDVFHFSLIFKGFTACCRYNKEKRTQPKPFAYSSGWVLEKPRSLNKKKQSMSFGEGYRTCF